MKERNAEDIHKSKKTNQTKAQNNNKIRKEISQFLISESNNLEGWGEEGDGKEVKREGTYVYLWSIHADTCRKQNSVKQLSFKLKKKNLRKTSLKSYIRESRKK